MEPQNHHDQMFVTGLSNYSSGEVLVFGYNVTRDYRDARRLIGLCTQEFNFESVLTIFQLLVYQAGLFRHPSG